MQIPEIMEKGMIISGGFGDIVCREKKDTPIELGELLVAETPDGKILLKAFDLVFGSQMSQQQLELISGLKLEEDSELDLIEPHIRAYTLARLRAMVKMSGSFARLCKTLPPFLSTVREVQESDLAFLVKPEHPLFIGNLRSGSKTLDVPVYIDGVKAISHHVLIPATTGKGKSNLTSVMLWQATGQDWCGLLVLDPHDEYFGRNGPGLRDHPRKDRVLYYSPNPVAGGRTLVINLGLLKPVHLQGVIDLSDPQKDYISSAYRQHGKEWVRTVLLGEPVAGQFGEGTIAVVKRRLSLLLDIEISDAGISCIGPFSDISGQTTPNDISEALERSCTVVIDTSSYDGSQELLIGSLIASEIFSRYKRHLLHGALRTMPVIGIFLEEAPRVLGKDALERGPNIFSTIAREGRKFRVGLVAITQLPSLIPRDILANMNTKLILGLEMKPERQAIIESASQDLSDDDREIASLDTGEVIVSSNFSTFAIPVAVPLFTEYTKNGSSAPAARKGFAGMALKNS